MLEPVKRPDARASWKWLWRSELVAGLLVLLPAAVSRQYFFALIAAGMIVGGLADYVDRRGGRLWWGFVGMGIILVAAGIFWGIDTGQLPNVFRNIFKP